MQDCARLPHALLSWLFEFFEHIEKGLHWPSRLTTARVVMLAKPEEDVHKPLSVRPITIVSALYRLWSRFRSLQVLQYLGEQLPPQIGGIANRLSSDVMVAYTCDIIEDAMISQQHCCGLVLDLQKCFNLIPRRSLAMLMNAIGIHPDYVVAHQSMLQGLVRYIELAGQIGDPQQSTNGVPEGCSFSVVSMVVLTALAAKTMLSVDPEVVITMFADNWAVIAANVEQLTSVIARLEQLVATLSMRIAPRKSWTWGTSSTLRRQLKRFTLGGEQVDVKLTAKDLGCDVSYSRKKCKRVAKKRLGTAVKTLHRELPKSFKAKMATTLGVGIAAYGSELQKHTKEEFHRLRSSTAAALGLHKSGASAWLAINATGLQVDPQLRMLKRKIKFFRRYFAFFPEKRAGFLSRISDDSPHRRWGVSKQFVQSFQEVGWQCKADGIMQHDCGLQFNWLCDDMKFVGRCLGKAWIRHTCAQVTRQHWDIEAYNVEVFAAGMERRDPRQAGILQALAAGRHVTNDGLKHYAGVDTNGKCQLCGCQDSKKHRFFRCSKLQTVREKYKDVYKWIVSQPEACFAFGVVPDDNEAMTYKAHLHRELHAHLPDEVDGTPPHIFTDGTCFFGDMWDAALAGASVIEADVEAETFREVNRFILPSGDHNAFRAESFAILDALERYYRCTLVVDCQSTIDLLARIRECQAEGRAVPFSQHGSLWDCIAQHILARPIDAIKVEKTKAHTNWKELPRGRDQFYARCNDAADQAA
eukprot:Skav232223  [mRNA]  locus=scaffold286:146845:149106:+ [translate_table: standard]